MSLEDHEQRIRRIEASVQYGKAYGAILAMVLVAVGALGGLNQLSLAGLSGADSKLADLDGQVRSLEKEAVALSGKIAGFESVVTAAKERVLGDVEKQVGTLETRAVGLSGDIAGFESVVTTAKQRIEAQADQQIERLGAAVGEGVQYAERAVETRLGELFGASVSSVRFGSHRTGSGTGAGGVRPIRVPFEVAFEGAPHVVATLDVLGSTNTQINLVVERVDTRGFDASLIRLEPHPGHSIGAVRVSWIAWR